jgi:heterodisulfide reductase subunit C
MRIRISTERVRGSFVKRVEEISGQEVLACNQCGKCSAGCPVAYAADLLPSQVIRLVQLGYEDVLNSQAIWLCASCLTCLSRCPKGVDLPRVMESLRQMSLRKGESRLAPSQVDPSLAAQAPQLALIAGFRKYTG